ncbi:acyltransferase [Bacillus sp. FJAT-18017]|uniref:acyltransferase n=1 Tax=Bacillus sp. FJAT-18017 TaxID=1705566 RepID=UPI0006AFCFC6|nr:acyltransferase [Bacillus sp. FJAT-18017]
MDRNFAIDFIKFFAIFAVVVIHTFPSDHVVGYFILDNISRFAVPFFFMASGYFFGRKVTSINQNKSYFKKYALKILKIYISWLVFYFIYDLVRIFAGCGNVRNELSSYFEGLSFLGLLYYGEATSGYQLWFVIALVWSIAILYLFFKLEKTGILLVTSFCLYIYGLFGQAYSVFFEFPKSTRDALFFGLFYTTAGFWFSYSKPLKHHQNLTKKTNFYLFLLFSILQIIEGLLLEKVLGSRHGEFFLSTMFQTIFLFSFALHNPQLGKGLLITKIGGNALGIYAVHVFLIDMVDLLFHSAGLGNVSHSLFWNLADAFLVFSLSYLAYQLIQSAKARLM